MSPPITAHAATTVTFDISKGSVDITDSDYYGYNSSGTIIRGSSSGVSFVVTGYTNTNSIQVWGTHNITLSDCHIDLSNTGSNDLGGSGGAAFEIAVNNTGNVNVTLVGSNTLESGLKRAGLEKKGNTSTGTLTISGTGKLTSTGGQFAAGIGGGYNCEASNITISGGKVIATGGSYGAGIGGGSDGVGSNITISGGTVTARGGNFGAGIGGGDNSSGSNITVSGGKVNADGGEWGAGIGGGERGDGSNITISGGVVIADGSLAGAGIGGGAYGDGSDITISDSTVTASGSADGAGIGGGYYGDGSNIIISGGSVKVSAGEEANAIGGGNKGGDAVTPTDSYGNKVYLNIIPNTNSTPVYIDGVSYTPVNHTAADPSDTNLYVYLQGRPYEITVGVSISATLSTSSVEYGASAPTLSVEGTYSTLTYLSSKPEVATIDSSGIITIKGVGTTTFTVTAA